MFQSLSIYFKIMLISANIALFSWFWIHCDAWLWELNGRLFERALLKTSALSCLCKLKSALRIKVSAYAIWFCDEYSIIYHLNGSDQPHFAIFFLWRVLWNLALCAKEIIINSSDVLISGRTGTQNLGFVSPQYHGEMGWRPDKQGFSSFLSYLIIF